MKKYIKVISIILSLFLLISFAACDERQAAYENAEKVETPAADNQASKDMSASAEPDKTHKADKNKPVQTTQDEEKADEPKEEPHTCTLEVRCDTIIKNMDKLDKSKTDYVPKDGIIFAKKEVAFAEGESAFDVLYRQMRANNIHMEFVNTPAYKSSYIEGIANIYEFDCGALSGWMYTVNGSFPGKGSSGYEIQPGDEITFLYTVDRGEDIGGDAVN